MAASRTEPPYNAAQDANDFPSLTAVSGTAGTADVSGTAEQIRIGGNPTTGALYVQDLAGAGGTNSVTVVSGTQQTLGTVGTVIGLGTATNLGSVTNVGVVHNAGTIAALPILNLTTGTITTGSLSNVAMFHAGTVVQASGTTTLVSTVTTLSSLTNGSVNILTGTLQSSGTTTGVGVVSNLTNGSVNILTGTLAVSLGTVGGKAASGVAAVANPVQIAGTDGGGTIYSPVVTTGGVLSALMPTGTVTTGSLSNVAMLNAGTVIVPTGTITTIAAGTQNTLGTVGVLNSQAAGTQQTLGTVGVVNNLVKGTITALETGTLTALAVGTIGGKAASGAAAVANPVLIAGTDAGGTIYAPLVTSAGAVSVTGASAGTFVNISTGTAQTLGTVGVVNNLVTGTIAAVTALSVGTIGGKAASGAAAVANPLQIAGTDAGGTIYSPLVTSAGALTVTGASAGTFVNIVTGTQQTLGTVGVVNNLVTGTIAAVTSVAEVVKGTTTLVSTVTTLSNLTNGSVNILTGTLQSSGTTTGVGVVSNLTNGSVNLLTGTVTSVTNLAAGTVKINPVPVPTTLQHGTLGTAGGSFFATISAASGAGTFHYISGVDIVMKSGTADVRVLAGSVIQGTGVLAAGQFPAGGGIAKNFSPAFATGTNSELIYHFVGAGSAFITVSYWKGI